MYQLAMPRNNEIGITDQRIPHNPEGAGTTNQESSVESLRRAAMRAQSALAFAACPDEP
jgi:hypothetical protein